jgi:hypothetical protein
VLQLRIEGVLKENQAKTKMRSGEIVFLDEIEHSSDSAVAICSEPPVASRGSYVRVVGHINFVETARRYCEISDGRFTLIVDLSVVDITAQLIPGNLCQFIGELRDFREKVSAERFSSFFSLHFYHETFSSVL